MRALPGGLRRGWMLLREPRATWELLAEAQPGPARVLAGYVLPLTLPAVAAGVVGFSVVGLHTDGFSYKLGWGAALLRGFGAWAAVLGGAWWMAQAAQRLAPLFRARGAFPPAWSSVAHAGTPLYLAGWLLVVPAVGRYAPLSLIACVPLLHLGLVRLMAPAKERAVPYTATVGLAGVAWWLLLSLVPSCEPRREEALEWAEIPAAVAGSPGTTPGQQGRAEVATGGERLEPGRGQVTGMIPARGLGGDGVLVPDRKGEAAPAGGGPGLGEAGAPPTRTVLQDLLPAAPEGYARDIRDSYAYAGPRDNAAGAIMNGAFTEAEYRGPTKAQPTYTLSLSDLTVQLGPLVARQLLAEVAETGGEQERGRVKRTVTEEGARIRVTEYEAHPNPSRCVARVEWVVAERYKVSASATGVELEALVRWAGQVDFGALERHAGEKRPVE